MRVLKGLYSVQWTLYAGHHLWDIYTRINQCGEKLDQLFNNAHLLDVNSGGVNSEPINGVPKLNMG